ncbi:MAG: hypothetical protein ABL886_15780 [Rhodoglobus sp.]
MTDLTNPKAPPGTKTGTVWIWLIVLLPLVSISSLFLIDVTGYMQAILTNPTSFAALFSLYVSPGFLATVGLSLLLYVLTVIFASRDVKVLTERGVPRPFHWAFAFFGPVVYVIGRSVVVKIRTGQGLAPLWGVVAVFGVSMIVSLIWTFWLTTTIYTMVPTVVPA